MPRVSLWRLGGVYRVSVYTHNGFGNPPVAILGGFFIARTKVDMRNETASNHYKQTQMGGLGDERVAVTHK